MYTPVKSKWITNNVLLYSTWNSFSVIWQPAWEEGLGKNGHLHMYGWVTSLSIWNYHNTVNWLSVEFSRSVVSDSLRPVNCSTPGLPVHHQLPELTQTHVHRVGDAIQPSHPLLSPSPPAPSPSQHQSLFQWVTSLHEVAKVLEFAILQCKIKRFWFCFCFYHQQLCSQSSTFSTIVQPVIQQRLFKSENIFLSTFPFLMYNMKWIHIW